MSNTSTTLPKVARHSPRHAPSSSSSSFSSASSSASSSPSVPSPKASSKGWKRTTAGASSKSSGLPVGSDRPERNPSRGGRIDSPRDDATSNRPRATESTGSPKRKGLSHSDHSSSSSRGSAVVATSSNKSKKAAFKVRLSEHQQQRVAKIEHEEREKMKKQRLREQRRNDQREALSEEARRASKHNRMLQETYTGAMSDFSTRRVIGREAQPWDPMTKLREEARLKRATERAEQDRRSAPLRKAMDRVLRGGVEPAIPMPYFRADALYKVLVREEEERRQSYREKFKYFQRETRKGVLDAVRQVVADLNSEIDSDPRLRGMHEFGVPDAVARATGMVKSFGQKLDADLPDDIVTEVQLVAAIEELSKELNQVNEAVGQAEGAFRVQRNALSERTSGKQQRIEKLKKEVIIPLVSRLDATRESIRVGPSAFHHSLHVIAAEEAVEAARRKLEQEWVLLQDVDVLNASSIEQELVPGCESVQNQAVALTESLDTLEAKLDTLRKEIEELKSGLADLPETTPFLQFEAKLHEVIDAQGREDTPEIQTAKERLARVRAYQRISNAESAAIKSRDPLPLRKLLSELDSASRTADPLLFSTKEAQDIRASAVSVAEQLEAEGNLYSAVLRHHDSRDKLSGALAEACRLSDLGSEGALESEVYSQVVQLLHENDKKHFVEQLQAAFKTASVSRDAAPLRDEFVNFVNQFRQLLSHVFEDVDALTHEKPKAAKPLQEDDDVIESRTSQDSPRDSEDSTKSDAKGDTSTREKQELSSEDAHFLETAKELVSRTRRLLAKLSHEAILKAAYDAAIKSRDLKHVRTAVDRALASGLDRNDSEILVAAEALVHCLKCVVAVAEELQTIAKAEANAESTQAEGTAADLSSLAVKIEHALEAGASPDLDESIKSAQHTIQQCQARVVAQLRVAIGLAPEGSTNDLVVDDFQPSLSAIEAALRAVDRAAFVPAKPAESDAAQREGGSVDGGVSTQSKPSAATGSQLEDLVAQAKALRSTLLHRENSSASLRNILARCAADYVTPVEDGNGDSKSATSSTAAVTFDSYAELEEMLRTVENAGVSSSDMTVQRAKEQIKTFKAEAILHAATGAARTDHKQGATLTDEIAKARRLGLHERSNGVFSEAVALSSQICQKARDTLEQALAQDAISSGSNANSKIVDFETQLQTLEKTLDDIDGFGLTKNDTVLAQTQSKIASLRTSIAALTALDSICTDLDAILLPTQKAFDEWLTSTQNSLSDAVEPIAVPTSTINGADLAHSDFVTRFHEAMSSSTPFPAEDIQLLQRVAGAQEDRLVQLQKERPELPQLQKPVPQLQAAVKLLSQSQQAKTLMDLVLKVCISYSSDMGAQVDIPLLELSEALHTAEDADTKLLNLGHRAVAAGKSCQRYRVLKDEVLDLSRQLATLARAGDADAMEAPLEKLTELIEGTGAESFKQFAEDRSLREQLARWRAEAKVLSTRAVTLPSKVFYIGDDVWIPASDNPDSTTKAVIVSKIAPDGSVRVRLASSDDANDVDETTISVQVIADHNDGEAIGQAQEKVEAAIKDSLEKLQEE